MMFSSSADKIEVAVSEARCCCHSVHPKHVGGGKQTTLMCGEVSARAYYSHSVPL